MSEQYFFLCSCENWELHIGNVPMLYLPESQFAIHDLINEHLDECDGVMHHHRIPTRSFR